MKRTAVAVAALFLGFAFAPQPASASVGTPDGVSTAPAGDVIAPQDTLQISVFQVNDLSRTVVVDQNGKISLPLIGEVDAGGKSAQALADDIAAKLKDGYVLSPQVSVLVVSSPNQHVTIEGEVSQPGVYPITGHTTLLEAVAMARGSDDMANESRVNVFRSIDKRRAVAMFDLKAIREGKADDPEIHPNDVIVVERSGAKSLLGGLKSIVPIIGTVRWAFF